MFRGLKKCFGKPKKDWGSKMTDDKVELDYPKKGSSGSSTDHGYSVEARLNYRTPKEIAGHILDNRWQTLQFDKHPAGVPTHGSFRESLGRANLLGYSAAQALRWWFHAIADATFDGICLETKLVQHVVRESHSVEAISEHMLIRGEDRSSSIPDWGNKGVEDD